MSAAAMTSSPKIWPHSSKPLLDVSRGCALIAPVDELEEKHRAALADRQVADLVDDQERGIGEDVEAASQLAGGLGFFERGDEVGQSAVIDSAPALRRGQWRG